MDRGSEAVELYVIWKVARLIIDCLGDIFSIRTLEGLMMDSTKGGASKRLYEIWLWIVQR